jgi:ABC-type Na+ transport system ATPase subunit NatA
MLQIRKLSKTYGNGVKALKDVSLDIPNGMFGLLGPNGAGKSTLMRTIATLQDPDTGTIRLNNLDVLGDKQAARRQLGYLPQEFGVYPKITAETMLDHFAVLKGVTARGERKNLVEALLQQVNLWDVRKRKLGTFSGGMRQRFGIAQALIGSPKLIIVDEPTAGLDPEERNRFLNLLAEMAESGVAQCPPLPSTTIKSASRCSRPGWWPVSPSCTCWATANLKRASKASHPISRTSISDSCGIRPPMPRRPPAPPPARPRQRLDRSGACSRKYLDSNFASS